MPAEIRRTLLQVQTTYKEGWKEVATPTKLVAALAVIRNPWFGRSHVEEERWRAEVEPRQPRREYRQ